MRPRPAGLLLLAAPLLVAASTVPAPAAGGGVPPALPRTRPAPPPARQTLLPSGLRVVVVERHQRPVVVVRLLLPRGSLSDPPAIPGATHLAVHLASDFHERGPRGEELVEEKSFRRQVVEIGGAPWFHVDPDFSALGISGYAADTGTYLRMLAEAVTRPRRGDHSFKARRNALLDAIEDLESSDPAALARVVAELSFGPGHPYARSVVGTAASLAPLGLEDVVAQQERVLVPAGATLLVVGDVEPGKVFAEARSAFARWRAEERPVAAPAPPPAAASGHARSVGLLRRSPASTLFVCATRSLSDVPGADAALGVLAALLGEGSGSRLAAALREENGLTYGASAEIVRRRHARALVACSALSAGEASRGIRLFRETLESVRTGRATEAELARARAVRLAEIDAAHDEALGTAAAWVDAIVLGDGIPRLGAERAAIEKVTAEELQALAAKALRPDTLRWVVSGEPGVAARAVEEGGLGRVQRLSPSR